MIILQIYWDEGGALAQLPTKIQGSGGTSGDKNKERRAVIFINICIISAYILLLFDVMRSKPSYDSSESDTQAQGQRAQAAVNIKFTLAADAGYICSPN